MNTYSYVKASTGCISHTHGPPLAYLYSVGPLSHFRRSTFTFLSGHFHFFSGQFCHFHHQFSPYLSFLLFWQKWHIFGASHKSCICQVSILVHEYEQAAKMANYILPITVMSQTPICRSPIYQGLLIFPLILSVYRCYCKTKPRFTGIPDLPG